METFIEPRELLQNSHYKNQRQKTLFELAMRYILDQRGMGKSFQDVLSLFYDLRQGISFPVSFENHFAISVSDYEDEFYDRMRTYLSSGY